MQLERQKQMSKCSKTEIAVEKIVCKIVLRVLQSGFQELYRLDKRVAEEVNQWENHMLYGLECPQGGPSLYLQWKDRKLVSVKNPKITYHDAVIRFTSMHMAFLVLTGQVGISGAYALHGFTLKGDIAKTMSFARCVDLIEAHLFPKIMTKRIMTSVPKKAVPSLIVYANIVKNIGIGGVLKRPCH